MNFNKERFLEMTQEERDYEFKRWEGIAVQAGELDKDKFLNN